MTLREACSDTKFSSPLSEVKQGPQVPEASVLTTELPQNDPTIVYSQHVCMGVAVITKAETVCSSIPEITCLKSLDFLKSYMTISTPYIRLMKFQLVRQIPDVYVSACVLAGKLFCCIFSQNT